MKFKPANKSVFYMRNIEEVAKTVDFFSKASMLPKHFKGEDGRANFAIALMYAQDVGLSVMQAIKDIAVINGKPALFGDSMLAVAQRSSNFEYIKEEFIKNGDQITGAICTVKRRGSPEHVRSFTISDAQTACLWNRSVPWKQYPKRMLQMRARSFALRDQFAAELSGCVSREEEEDREFIESTCSQVTENEPVKVLDVSMKDVIIGQIEICDNINALDIIGDDICEQSNISDVELDEIRQAYKIKKQELTK